MPLLTPLPMRLPIRLIALIVFLSLAASLSAQDPALVGRFGPLIKAELVPIHTILLPNGKILYVDRHDQGTHDMTPRVWDPATNTTIKTPTPTYDLFCSGHSMLRNGNIFFSGGHIVDGQGVDNLSIYEWRTNTWDTKLPRMFTPRWYPTNTPLPNGDVLISSGSAFELEKYVDRTEIFDSRTRTLRSLDGAVQIQSYYPFMYVLPGNKVFAAGSDSITRILDVTGNGKWATVGMTKAGRYRAYGSSVQYERGKIMVCGGNKQSPLASAEMIDMNVSGPSWKYTDSMHFSRRHHTAVILPDGKVFVNGGTSAPGFNNADGAVKDAEIWDPLTGHWTLMARAASIRLYHSIALLLPDGRVLTGGGGHPGDDANFEDAHPDFEIYEPPYLFQGTRPVITSAPDSIYYGKPFTVGSVNGGNLKVSLFRLGCATHAWDHNTDFNRLAVTRLSAASLQVDAPADSVASAPGPHMLFLVDSAGIPSTAKIVWLNSPSGGAGVSGPVPARGLKLSVAGSRLRTFGLDISGGAVCRLQDGRGRTVAIPANAGRGEFLIPSDLPPGAYTATLRSGNLTVTSAIALP